MEFDPACYTLCPSITACNPLSLPCFLQTEFGKKFKMVFYSRSSFNSFVFALKWLKNTVVSAPAVQQLKWGVNRDRCYSHSLNVLYSTNKLMLESQLLLRVTQSSGSTEPHLRLTHTDYNSPVWPSERTLASGLSSPASLSGLGHISSFAVRRKSATGSPLMIVKPRD